MSRRSVFNWLAVAALSTGLAACGPVEDESVEGVEVGEATASLTGIVLDWNDQPVANADVNLLINGKLASAVVMTDADGRYELPVNVEAIDEAETLQQEITLAVHSPYEDRGERGTYQGDRIRLLPVTLREFIDMDTVVDGAQINVRTAYVPVQSKGYKITPELVANGGELSWTVKNPNGEDDITITLVVEPNSIVVDGDDPQDEITLTVLDDERAPMQVAGDGFGVLWTIQPRDIAFDPPARLKMTGNRLEMVGLSEVEVGSPFEIFGATLDRGWQNYGDVQIAGMDGMTMTLESQTGVIPRGAWGHVLANPASNAGILVTCQNLNSGEYVPCAIVSSEGVNQTFLSAFPLFQDYAADGDVSISQQDYRPGNNPGDPHYNRPFWYTDLERQCGNCSNLSPRNPGAQMATGLTLDGQESVDVFVVPLCPSEIAQTDMGVRDAMLALRLNTILAALGGEFDGGEAIDAGDGEGTTPQTIAWDEYCDGAGEGDDDANPDNETDGCPEFGVTPANYMEGQRVRFARSHTFTLADPIFCF